MSAEIPGGSGQPISGGDSGRGPADPGPQNAADRERYEQGMAVRREVLGDEHVDRANDGITDFTADFQDYVSRVAWGDIWSRPGLDRKSRSVAVLTAMMAMGHHDEFVMHVRAALRNGLSADEIKEVILQAGLYCGVPVANTAFQLAREVLEAHHD